MITLLIARTFWTLLGIEAVVAAGVIVSFSRSRSGSPDGGMVGAWVLFLLPVLLALAGVVVYWANSARVTLGATVFLAFPLVAMACGPLYEMWSNRQTSQGLAGDDYFREEGQRNLAHAITALDPSAVARFIPAAGDLNIIHHGETFLCFALDQAYAARRRHSEPDAAVGIAVVKTLLAAGANPNLPSHSTSWPLWMAISQGPDMTAVLLNAGANPNSVDERPTWWHALESEDKDSYETLQLLLSAGADLTLRHSEGGAVGWAGNSWNWRAVDLLIERGAPWKQETQYGKPVAGILRDEALELRARHQEVPLEMQRVMAKYSAIEQEK